MLRRLRSSVASPPPLVVALSLVLGVAVPRPAGASPHGASSGKPSPQDSSPRKSSPRESSPQATSQPWGVGGDTRFRVEHTIAPDDGEDRLRFRLRLRLHGHYDLDSLNLRIGGRATTGDPDDPNSPYQDLGSLFDRFPLSLDRLYLRWTPVTVERDGEVVRRVELHGGKFPHGFQTNPVYGELVWDQDVQPEGVLGLVSSRHGAWRLAARAGGYVLLERSRGDDVVAFVGQLGVEREVAPGTGVGGALALYAYSDPTPDDAREALLENRGNAVVDRDGDDAPDAWASQFRIVDLIVHGRRQVGDQVFRVAAQLVRNPGASVPEDTGWAVGVSTRRDLPAGDPSARKERTAGDPSSERYWTAGYQYQRIERDAVFSPTVQDDFVFATNFAGHVLGFRWVPRERLGLRAWALVARPLEPFLPGSGITLPDESVWRLRLDVDVSF